MMLNACLNPFETQKKLFDAWEKNLATSMDRMMRKPEYMSLVSQQLGSTLKLRGMLREPVDATLKSLGLPNQDELQNLYKTVNDLESRMLDLEERLEDSEDARSAMAARMEAPPAPSAAPAKKARTKSAARATRSASTTTRKSPRSRKGGK